MTSWVRALVCAAALSVTSVGHAGDFCFNTSSPSHTPDEPSLIVVAQKFKVPRPGKCAAIVGFEYASTNFTFPRPASGTACTNSAGALLHVGIMIHAAKGPPPVNTDSEIHLHMILDYPTLATGQVYIRRDLPLLSNERSNGFAGPCGLPVSIP
jgi:hypothetical protein